MMNGWLKKMSGKTAVSLLQVKTIAGGLFELSKLHLSSYIALTAVTGHVLAENRVTAEGWVIGFNSFINI